jgi:DNA polymerase
MFVGEGPGGEEDLQGEPFVGQAGRLLDNMLKAIRLTRDKDTYIANVVKCRPPGNRDPEPDEVAACAPYLHRQLEALDPAVIVTLGRHSMGRFMPGARISQAHGTTGPVDPATGAPDATVFAMYHPAAALRTPSIERESYDDVSLIPTVLLESRERRREKRLARPETTSATTAATHATAATSPVGPVIVDADTDPTDQLTFF